MGRLTIRDYKSAVFFNNTSDFLHIPITAALTPGTNGFGVSMWMKWANPMVAGTHAVVQSSLADYTTGYLISQIANDLLVYVNSGGPLATFTGFFSPSNFQLGTWIHFAFTVSSADRKVRIYKNGALYATSAAITAWNIANSGSISVSGTSFGGPIGWNVSDVIFYGSSIPSDAAIAALYAQGIQPAGAVARYKLDEGVGTSAIDSIAANTGTLSFAAVSGYFLDSPMKARPTMRDYPSCPVFTQSPSFARSGANTGITTGAFTMSAWVNPQSFGAYNTALNFGATNTTYLGLRSGSPDITVGGVGSVTAARVIGPPNQWYELTATFAGTGGAVNIYVNGTPVVASGSSTSSTTDGKFTVGSDQLGNNGWLGLLQDARLWNVVLTPTQVRAMYLTGVVPTSGLIRRYIMTEGVGLNPTLADSSVTGDSAAGSGLTWTNATSNRRRAAFRNYPYSAQFNGTSSKIVSSSNTGLSGTNSLTMSCWFKPSAVGNQGLMSIGAAGAGNQLMLLIAAGQLGWFNTTANNQGGRLVPNVWYHGVVTYDGASARVYLNGALVDGPDAITQTLTNSKLFIGCSVSSSSFFGGYLTEACLWNRALSASEITALYNQGSVPSSGLLRYYKLADGQGSAPADSSTTNDSAVASAFLWSADAPMKPRFAVQPPSTLNVGTVSASDYLNVPDTVDLRPGSGSYGFSFWVKFNGSALNGTGTILEKGNYSTTGYALFITTGATTVSFYHGFAGAPVYNSSTLLIAFKNALTQWIHVTYTYNQSDLKLRIYVNGVLVDTSGVLSAWNVTSTGAITIGESLTLGTATNQPANYADWIFYTSSIPNDAAVLALYQSGTIPASAVHRYKMNDGSGTSAKDFVGSNTATLTGTAVFQQGVNPPAESRLVASTTLQNLFTNSQTPGGSGWADVNLTAAQNTGDTLDAYGGSNAAKLTDTVDGGNTQHYFYENPTPAPQNNAVCTVSIPAKKGTDNYIALAPNGAGVAVSFNLNDGVTMTTIAGSPISSAMKSMGNGWYLCSLTFTYNAAAPNVRIYMSTSAGSVLYTGAGTGTIYVCDAQFVHSNWPGPRAITGATSIDVGPIRNLP